MPISSSSCIWSINCRAISFSINLAWKVIKYKDCKLLVYSPVARWEIDLMPYNLVSGQQTNQMLPVCNVDLNPCGPFLIQVLVLLNKFQLQFYK